MIKIAISGIKGRMGRSVYQSILEDKKTTLTCATISPNDPDLGKSVDEVLGGGSSVLLTNNLSTDFDVLIDFTSITLTLANLDFCRSYNKAIVIGTTGFDKDEEEVIKNIATNIPIFKSANMSVGINVMQKIISMASEVLYERSDIEIVEAHHKHKVDSPSGTALMLGDTIANTLNISLQDKAVFSRFGITGEREDGCIGFSTIRGGDVIGEHSVNYYMQGEVLEVTHKATDRRVFARGAVFAAYYLTTCKKGIYNMFDALSLN